MAVLEEREGHREEALRLLELAYAKHDSNVRDLLLGDEWNAYRDEPRFRALLRELGIA